MQSIQQILEESKLDLIEKLDSPLREIQILRIGMIEEAKAINLYENMAKLSNDEQVRKMCLDIAKEEKVHLMEFQTLLSHLDSEFESTKSEAEQEVSEKFS